MKKIFQIIGLISLICFSFFVTEKTTTVINDMDDIMVEIKSNYKKYKTESIDAIINENTIIPGIRGKKVNIKKSYKNMKINGYYSDKLFIYDYINPKVSLINNKDKYIIKGNPKKRNISLIFNVKDDDNIDEIINILNNYNVKSTFFINENWFSNNTDQVQRIIKEGHNIGIMLEDYSNSSFEWLDMVIKKVNHQKIGFCYNEEENKENINQCALRNNYTIRPIKISSTTPLQDIKSNLESGNLYIMDISNIVRKELSTIIISIKSKGLNITNLEEHILE